MSIAGFSVKNSILANLLTIVVVVLGGYVAIHLQREVFPETDLDIVVISTLYPDASPSEVEDLITVPLEQEIREIEEIEEYFSTSIEGASVILAFMDPDARDLDRAISDLQRKVDQFSDLPEEAEEPIVESITTAQPVLNICISGLEDERALRTYSEYLRSRLERLDGVSTVSRSGWRDEEFQVELNLESLREQELTIADVMAVLAKRNVSLPGGKYTQGGEEIVLRTVGKFKTAEEIANVIVRSNPDGKQVKVCDLGTVKRAFEDGAVFATSNGSRALILGVKKQNSGDSIKVADAAKALIAAELPTAPEGLEMAVVDDASFYVKRRLQVLQSNGLMGFLMVMVCLFVFLNFRVALFTAFGIPFSFLAALILMAYFGMTINLMTMFGMIIVLGMLVDDAIIVGENVFRYLEDGMEPAAAAVRGTDQVMSPVIATVLTTIAAFLPLVFAPDMYAKYLGWLVWVVVFALIASLFEVLFILPSHLADFAKPLRRADGSHKSGKSGGHRIMKWMMGAYASTLKGALRFRYLFLLFTLIGFIGSGMLAKSYMKIDIFPADLIDVFFVRVTTSQGTPLDDTAKLVQNVEDKVRELPDSELDNIVTFVGKHVSLEGAETSRGTHRAQVSVYLTPKNTRDRKTEEIIDELRETCAGLPGIEVLEFEMVKPGPPVGKPLEMNVSGPDFDVLQEITEEMKAFLARQPGVFDITDNFEEGKRELHLKVDESEAARLGLNVEQIARSIFAGLEGAKSTLVREGKEELEVKVSLQEQYHQPADLLRIPIRNAQGRAIELSKVAGLEETRGLPSIVHYNGDRTIQVGAFLDTEVTSAAEVNLALEQAFARVPIEHPGYELIPGGEWKETKKLSNFMVEAFVLAGMLIYTILAVQFRSFMQPFVLLAAIPLGLVGVVLALIVHDKPVSIMAMMGMVGLGGVVVNDAIVLVSFINEQRRDGVHVFDAIVESGMQRLRPIVLTSVTTVAGLLPVIYGWGGYEPFIAPAAITLAYGLVFASFLTLMIVPCLYLAAYDTKQIISRVGRAFRGAINSTANST